MQVWSLAIEKAFIDEEFAWHVKIVVLKKNDFIQLQGIYYKYRANDKRHR